MASELLIATTKTSISSDSSSTTSKVHRLPNCVMTHVNACGQHMTILRRFGPPLQGNVVVIDGGVGRRYVVQPWYQFLADNDFSHSDEPQKGWISYNPRTVRLPPLAQETKFVKLCPGNVNGLRALLKLEGFPAVQLSQREDFDVLCLQDTKLQGEYWSLYASGYIFQQSPVSVLLDMHRP
ncbi:hypothetical protein JHK87_004574 [Glycine soja]|nr:hypothetical protein JHK87_004574 [Glycine soja]